MSKKTVQANRSYVVQRSKDDGTDMGAYVLDQYVPRPNCQVDVDRIRNQVEAHLFHQFRKTGVHHHVVFEGDPYQAEEIAHGRDGIPF